MRIFLLNPGEEAILPEEGLSERGRAQVDQVIGHLCDLDYYKQQNAYHGAASVAEEVPGKIFTSHAVSPKSSPGGGSSPTAGALLGALEHQEYHVDDGPKFFAPPDGSEHVLVIYHGASSAAVAAAECVRERVVRDGTFSDAMKLQLLSPATSIAVDFWRDLLRTRPGKIPRTMGAVVAGIETASLAQQGGLMSPTTGAGAGKTALLTSSDRSTGQASEKGTGSRVASDRKSGVGSQAAGASGVREQSVAGSGRQSGAGASEGNKSANMSEKARSDTAAEQEKTEDAEPAAEENAEQHEEAAGKPAEAGGDNPADEKKSEVGEQDGEAAAGQEQKSGSKKSGSGAKSSPSWKKKSAVSAVPVSQSNMSQSLVSDVAGRRGSREDSLRSAVGTNAVASGQEMLAPPVSPQSLQQNRPKVDRAILARIGSAVFSVLFVVEEPFLRRMIAELTRLHCPPTMGCSTTSRSAGGLNNIGGATAHLQDPMPVLPTDFGGDVEVPSKLLPFLKLRPGCLVGLEAERETELPKWVVLGEKSLHDFHWELFFLLTPEYAYSY
ncbi:unnamed protein product [Amoebophrya sp. A25]|nr:unnamed protein product [Amoebophrya sp. A25]|eukprot:GSA25T00000742001.1